MSALQPNNALDAMKDTVVVREAVHKHFAFLSAHGFGIPTEKASEHSCTITYCSPVVTIGLWFGPPQFEVELAFWRTSAADKPLHVGDLVVLGVGPQISEISPTLSGIEAQVAFFAAAVRSFEDQLCSGDAAFYENLASARDTRVAAWHQDVKLRQLRTQVEAAWRVKDYVKVAELYKAMQPSLELTEEKRLAYAEKKLGKAP